MDPDRWRRIEELYQSAVEFDLAERATLLANADPEMRREVESLLAQPTADTPLDRSALSALNPLHVETGALVGPYRIEGLLGEGGMGVVYRAFDPKLQRPVAVKLLPDLADAAGRHRFQREARTVTALNHPHILTVYDVGEHDGRQYLVTELVDGGTLRSWAEADKRSSRQIVDVLVGVADGLRPRMSRIIHAISSPRTLLIRRTATRSSPTSGWPSCFTRETNTRRRGGDDRAHPPGMMREPSGICRPSRHRGTRSTRAATSFLRAVLYELFAGTAVSASSDLDELQRIVHGTPEPLAGEIPVRLRMVVEKALEKDPAERYQTAREMVIDLRRASRQTGSGDAAATRPPEKIGDASRALGHVGSDARPSSVAPPSARQPSGSSRVYIATDPVASRFSPRQTRRHSAAPCAE